MRLVEFRAPSHHPGQTTDTPVFVNPEHVIHATVARTDPPAMSLTLSSGKDVEVAGEPAEVMKAIGGSVKAARIADPDPADAFRLYGVKGEHERVRDGARDRRAQGALEEDRPDDDGEGRERREFGTDRDPVAEEGARREAEREEADKLKADREKRQEKSEAERAKAAEKAKR